MKSYSPFSDLLEGWCPYTTPRPSQRVDLLQNGQEMTVLEMLPQNSSRQQQSLWRSIYTGLCLKKENRRRMVTGRNWAMHAAAEAVSTAHCGDAQTVINPGRQIQAKQARAARGQLSCRAAPCCSAGWDTRARPCLQSEHNSKSPLLPKIWAARGSLGVRWGHQQNSPCCSKQIMLLSIKRHSYCSQG